MAELLLPLAPGLGDQEESSFAQLGDGTVNFYPDGEGYIVNYPGKTDIFKRPQQPPSYLGTPPPLGTSITRVLAFRDVRRKEHVVFVRGAELCVVYGNSYRVIYTFGGQDFENGKFFPTLFVHEAKLIIANLGDPVLLWDGIKEVHPLGVQETPLPPQPRTGKAPWTESYADGTDKAYGPWAYRVFWWPGAHPVNGPGQNLGADAVTKVHTLTELVVQFFDEYGNHGPPSPPSNTIDVKPDTLISAPSSGNEIYTDTPEYNSPEFLVFDYYPPQVESHIVGVRVGRTLNLNLDGGAGARGVYFTEVVVPDTTTGRGVCLLTDGQLANSTPIDLLTRGPTQAAIGCSWNRRVLLAGHEDPYVVSISDLGLFGQFRTTYRAADHVKAIVPMGDRVVVVTRSTVETLYDNNGATAILEQNRAYGSIYGRSFVEVGNTVFGLWNHGFGFYDGTKLTLVPAPYFLQDVYVDARSYVYAAVKNGDWYYLSVRKDLVTTGQNYLLLFHLVTHQWYLLNESVYDVAVWQGAVLGCNDSLYQLFRGTAAMATLVVKGLVPAGRNMLNQRSLTSFRLLLEPSSVATLELEIDGDLTSEQGTTTQRPFHSLPSRSAGERQEHPLPYWSTDFQYAETPAWVAPRDVWVSGVYNLMVVGYSHSMKLKAPAGHPLRLKALGLTFSEDARGLGG